MEARAAAYTEFRRKTCRLVSSVAIVLVACWVVGRQQQAKNPPVVITKPTTYSSNSEPSDGNVLVSPSQAEDEEAHVLPECEPKRLHIAQGNNVDQDALVSMTVSFSLPYNGNGETNSSCWDLYAHDRIIPAVDYGRGVQTLGHIWVSDDPLQFTYASDHYDGIFYSDYLYHVTIPNLVAGEQEHWYRVYLIPKSALSPRRSLRAGLSVEPSASFPLGTTPRRTFRTPPLPGTPTAIALVGDLGQTEHSLKTMTNMLHATEHGCTIHHGNQNNDTSTPKLSQLIIAGDMSYADSDPQRWVSWFDKMEPLMDQLPTHVVAGNHEIECDTRTRDIFVQYEHYFANPNRLGPAKMLPVTDEYRKTLWNEQCSGPSSFLGYYVNGNSFSSYQHGMLHVILLNSYTYSTEGSEQYDWLVDELEHNFDRSVTPYLMVVFHSPLYTTFTSHIDEIQSVAMKKSMEKLFVKYAVNWVISGHDHAYMRTKSLKYGYVDPTGRAPVYFTLGAGGNREGHSKVQPDRASWVARRSSEDWGFGHLYMVNETHAYFQWIQDGFASHEIRDPVWYVNPHTVVPVETE